MVPKRPKGRPALGLWTDATRRYVRSMANSFGDGRHRNSPAGRCFLVVQSWLLDHFRLPPDDRPRKADSSWLAANRVA